MTNRFQKRIEPKEIITEMCDICGKDCIAPIPRTMYLTKRMRPYSICKNVFRKLIR